jgi:hypothetical protein
LAAARNGDTAALSDLLQQAFAAAPPSAPLSVRRVLVRSVVRAARDSDHGAGLLHLFCASLPAATTAEDDGASAADIQQGIRLLLAAGVSVDDVCGNGSTPLHWAAGAGAAVAVRELLQAGADPTLCTFTWRRQVFGRGSGQTPLHWAAESNYPEIVALLANWTPLLPLVEDERGRTPLDVSEKELAFGSKQALQRATDEKYVVLRVTLLE